MDDLNQAYLQGLKAKQDLCIQRIEHYEAIFQMDGMDFYASDLERIFRYYNQVYFLQNIIRNRS